MKALHRRMLVCRAGALWILSLFFLAVGPVFPAGSSFAGSAKSWTHFDLDQEDSGGDLKTGKTVALTITLGGITQGASPVVAICESVLYEPRTVTFEPEAESAMLKATAMLEPLPLSRTSVDPKAARIQVTFARLRQGKFEPFLRRIVYLTLDPQESFNDVTEPSPTRSDEPSTSDLIVEEVQPDVNPVSSGQLAEEDLMPFADPVQGTAYWKQVSYLVSRSWARHVRGVRRGPSSETVKVRFKLYPNGRAQLIEIEKGSGSREINVSGIFTIVDAQPFPPFPAELGQEVFDVHVRMRTGARARPRGVESVEHSLSKKSNVPTAGKK